MSQIIVNYNPAADQVPTLFLQPDELYAQFKHDPTSIEEHHPLCGLRISSHGCDYLYQREEAAGYRCSSLTAPGKNRCPYHDHPIFSQAPTLEQFREYRPHAVALNIDNLRSNPPLRF